MFSANYQHVFSANMQVVLANVSEDELSYMVVFRENHLMFRFFRNIIGMANSASYLYQTIVENWV